MGDNAENIEVESNEVEEQVEQKEQVEVTYSEEEVQSKVSKAVEEALKKQRVKQAKESGDVAAELAELKQQLAQERNLAYVSKELTSRNIPAQLADLFYSADEDSSKAKLDIFSKWYKSAIDTAVKEELAKTEVPQFRQGTPRQKKGPASFLDFVKDNQ